MSSPARSSPARKSHLPHLRSATHSISPYRKAAAGGSWKDVALPDIPGMSGPAGPAGPVDDQKTDMTFHLKESKALSTWQEVAQNGDAEAQNNIGVSYYRGVNGVQKSPEMAVTWWVKAAAQGFAEAQFNLAVCLLHGKGVRKDEVGAIKMLKGAAEQDHTEALCMLASLHAEGLAGLPQSKEEAISLYAAAENLGSEEARYKKLVLEDLVARETELEALQKKIGKINDGFIQLQLERAANEEVSHAYKGAGFFLSNMKSETPARARIEQAKRAEQEIKKLRESIVDKDYRTMSLSEQIEAGKQEIKTLLERIRFLEEASDGSAGKMDYLHNQCMKLEASELRLKNQVKDLLTENTELRAVAEWAKNQRVESLKQSLSAVVKTTIVEQAEREKMLRKEIQNLRRQLSEAGGGTGDAVVVHDESDDGAAFLKRVRRDMLLQEIMLKEILMDMRQKDEYSHHVQFLKEAMAHAGEGDKRLKDKCEEILDHTSKSLEDSTDERTQDMCAALRRIMTTIETEKPPAGALRPSTALVTFKREGGQVKSQIARISENVLAVHNATLPDAEKEQQLGELLVCLKEVEEQHRVLVSGAKDHLESGLIDPTHLEEFDEVHSSIIELTEMLNAGVSLSDEQRAKLMRMVSMLQTPAQSRIGTAGSRFRSVGGQFRPTSASAETMTDSRRSPDGKLAKDMASSPVNFGKRSPDATKGAVAVGLSQEDSGRLIAHQTDQGMAARFDEEIASVSKKLDKVLKAVRGEAVSTSSSRPITPVHSWIIGEDGERRPKTSDGGSQTDQVEVDTKKDKRSEQSPGRGKAARIAQDMDAQLLEGRIKVLEAEKKQLESEKGALDAELRLAKNEAKRAILELEGVKKNVEQQIAFEKAMLRDEIKAAHDDADQARAERDKVTKESTELVTHMENELERKREAFEESAKKINESSQETMREVMESFASKVAVHLSITGAAGGGGGGGASEELMADIGKQMQSVKKEIASKNETLVEMLQELDTTLKINAKRASRSQLGSRGGDGLANDPRMSSHPGVVAPLPPEEMDAIKADLHFAVAGAMKNVLDEHRGGVVLLNLPDHNKPAGFMHGDGAGMLHHTIIENMREQKVLHSKLADDMDEIRLRFGKLEEKMHIQLSSMKQSAGGAVIDKQPKAATKLLYAVQNQNGSQASIESRLLPSLEQDALNESVDEMKELLQSWYRSFSFVSRLQNAVKH